MCNCKYIDINMKMTLFIKYQILIISWHWFLNNDNIIVSLHYLHLNDDIFNILLSGYCQYLKISSVIKRYDLQHIPLKMVFYYDYDYLFL